MLGYTSVNDVSSRYCQEEDRGPTGGKGFDTFAPIGPCVETEAAPKKIKLETYVNGQLRQSFNTNDLIFKIPYLICFISGIMTLLSGDIISTGTAAGSSQMNPGDVLEVKTEKIGTLRHFVKTKE